MFDGVIPAAKLGDGALGCVGEARGVAASEKRESCTSGALDVSKGVAHFNSWRHSVILSRPLAPLLAATTNTIFSHSVCLTFEGLAPKAPCGWLCIWLAASSRVMPLILEIPLKTAKKAVRVSVLQGVEHWVPKR